MRGFLNGLVAKLAMLPPGLLAFSRYGLRGVFEWHEVHASPACASGVSICSSIGRSNRPLKKTA